MMPKYNYFCKVCSKKFVMRHSITEKLKKHPDCAKEDCNIERVPISSRVIKKDKKKSDGDVVKKFIEDTKKEIAEEKKELKKEFKQ